jgi:hypothetical protein
MGQAGRYPSLFSLTLVGGLIPSREPSARGDLISVVRMARPPGTRPFGRLENLSMQTLPDDPPAGTRQGNSLKPQAASSKSHIQPIA